MEDEEHFDRLCRGLYVAARAAAVDPQAAFDLAIAWLEVHPEDPEAAALAALSAGYADASGPSLAAAVLRLLPVAGFHPGFREEPEWLRRLQDAMRVVNRDVTATGLAPCRLRVRDDEPGLNGNAYVETADGHTGIAQGVFPVSGADPLTALLEVADDAQDAVNHALFAAWPVCPAHRTGVHARALAGDAVWWCAGAGGHAVAEIGRWPA